MQALRQVLLNLDQGALDCTLKALDTGRAMTLHDNPLQAEKARAIVPGGRQVGLQALHQRQGQGTDQFCRQIFPEQRLDAPGDHGCQAFAGFEQDVADKTVTHHDIRLTTVQAVPFDKTDVVQHAGVLQQGRRKLDLLIALDVFGTDVQQRHPGTHHPERLRRHRTP